MVYFPMDIGNSLHNRSKAAAGRSMRTNKEGDSL